jgi:uncharacterized protein
MAAPGDTFDLGRLRLASGAGRTLDLETRIEPIRLGDDAYAVTPRQVPVRLDVSRTTGEGYALRLRFTAGLEGPCMRCLEDAAPAFAVDAREVFQPGGGEDLETPYVADEELRIGDWARDALVLALPPALLCRPDCAGLCDECGADLNTAGDGHFHEKEPDPRWAALRDLGIGQG